MKRSIGLGLVVVFLCASGSYFYRVATKKDPHFAVIIPSYNNSAWYRKNLDSLVNQTNKNWHAVYIDDCSTDGTGEAVERYISENKLQDKIRLIRNKNRRGALANLHDAIHETNDSHIVVTFDGDDWLAGPDALTIISRMYEDKNTWMTYGSYAEYPSGSVHPPHAIPALVVKGQAYRRAPWLSSHLRTFYAWLFKRIKSDDLKMNGQFYQKTGDMAFMFPLLEMAGTHARWCEKVVYIYNLDNPINDWKEDLHLVLTLDKMIRAKKPYERLA